RAAEGASLSGGSALGRRLTKSSIMVGLGESDDEVIEAMRDLREAGVDVVTIGQYLRPTPKHHEVVRFVHPHAFPAYQPPAADMGFLYAASGPLVRSSYRAAEVFLRSLLSKEEGSGVASSGGHVDPRRLGAMLEERRAIARREAARVNLGADRPTPTPSLGTP